MSEPSAPDSGVSPVSPDGLERSGASSRDEADAKAWFYLDHREDIEAWASLRSEGRALLEKSLVGIATDLDEFAEEVSAARETTELADGSWPTVGLYRTRWATGGIADADVVVQWERSRLLVRGAGTEWPYVGVRIRTDLDDTARRSQICEAVRPFRSQFTGKPSRNFPCWGHVRASGPLDPEAYVADVLAAYRRLWAAVAPALDAL
ncbi:hypothetical protein [Nocardioides kribbensis]|uniref:hypothetical protein n=1 Tax=Nocardioides kribbensis TaxID=305517 RepID=UPI00187AD4B3|nr:hypothetical protein [Nocardioides kribbensis]